MKLSVVMPVYNEQATLREVISRVLAVPLEIELICVAVHDAVAGDPNEQGTIASHSSHAHRGGAAALCARS